MDPSPTDKYICTQFGMQCFAGWNGSRCSRPICKTPCANSGFCTAPDQCACQHGWRGPNCEECETSSSCQNGYCVDEPYKCICRPNWTGPDCSLLMNKCLEKPCMNGGRCTTNGTNGDYYHCDCPSGYTGINCSILTAVCEPMPCGPHGQCIPLSDKDYTCICAHGFGGLSCNQRLSPERTESHTHNTKSVTHEIHERRTSYKLSVVREFIPEQTLLKRPEKSQAVENPPFNELILICSIILFAYVFFCIMQVLIEKEFLPCPFRIILLLIYFY